MQAGRLTRSSQLWTESCSAKVCGLHKHMSFLCLTNTSLRHIGLKPSLNHEEDLAPVQAGRMLVQQGIMVARGALPFG